MENKFIEYPVIDHAENIRLIKEFTNAFEELIKRSNICA